jgi:hypothetical protein
VAFSVRGGFHDDPQRFIRRPVSSAADDAFAKAPAITQTGTLVQAPPGTVGLDRSASIQTQAPALFAAGYRFALRTVSLGDQTDPGVISSAEAQAILAAGMMLGLVQVYRNTGVTADQGTQDGQAAVQQANLLGAPSGLLLWYDLEGTFSRIRAARRYRARR